MRKELEDKLTEECGKAEGITDDDRKEIIARAPPSTRTGKCFYSCVAENLGITKDYHVSIEGGTKIAQFAFTDQPNILKVAIEVLTECKNVDDADRCEMADKLMKCGMAASNARGMDFHDII